MKKFLIFLVIAALLFAGYKYFSRKPASAAIPDSNADLILYWGDGCPHCAKVKQYITDNKIDQKIKISEKEVYYNQDNQKQLVATAKLCPEINTSQGIGVPLAFIPQTKKCLLGDQPIIDWLTTKK